MAYRVRDGLEVSIRINDLEYPLNNVNVLNFLHMASGTKTLLPTLNFSLVDLTKSIPVMQLSDASTIQVIINDNGVLTARNFRYNSMEHPPSSELYNIDAFWDAPKFRVGTTNKPITGSSNTALSQIASACGLQFSGVPTNDMQMWLPRNRTFGQFAAYIAAYGYAGAQSHMAWAVDSTGVFRYRDARKPQLIYPGAHGIATDKALRIQEYLPLTKSGFNNALGGYRHTRVLTSIFKDEQPKSETLTFTPDSKKLLVNDAVRRVQERGVFSYSPIDFGNTHPNYEQARYQNTRFSQLKNLACEFLIFNPTKIEPLDALTLTTNASTPGEYDGQYLITFKTIYIQGNTYCEKLVGVREGLS